MKCDEIAGRLEEMLSGIARSIIAKNSRLPEEYRQRFSENPDAVEEHESNWHQWGIVTHSIKMREMYPKVFEKYLSEWFNESPEGTEFVFTIVDYLRQKVDGVTRADLIEIAMPLHDLGKFMKGVVEEGGKLKYDFDGHDKPSQEIISGPEISGLLKSFGLTHSQIEYVAACAGNHYELGFVRKEAKKSEKGYTISFAETELGDVLADRMDQFSGLEIEVGLLFLLDSLAKTDVILQAKTDGEVGIAAKYAEGEIEQRGLEPKLINAVRQMPVNAAVARKYLEIAVEHFRAQQSYIDFTEQKNYNLFITCLSQERGNGVDYTSGEKTGPICIEAKSPELTPAERGLLGVFLLDYSLWPTSVEVENVRFCACPCCNFTTYIDLKDKATGETRFSIGIEYKDIRPGKRDGAEDYRLIERGYGEPELHLIYFPKDKDQQA